MKDNYDDGGVFYLTEQPPVDIGTLSAGENPAGVYEVGETMFDGEDNPSTSALKKEVYNRVIAKYRDPLTLPKTRTKCVKTCTSDFPPIKFCCGWKTQQKHMNVVQTLVVQLKTAQDIKKEIEECLATGVVAAAAAAIYSGGSAAIAAFEKVFFICLETKVGANLIHVQVRTKAKWSGWY